MSELSLIRITVPRMMELMWYRQRMPREMEHLTLVGWSPNALHVCIFMHVCDFRHRDMFQKGCLCLGHGSEAYGLEMNGLRLLPFVYISKI